VNDGRLDAFFSFGEDLFMLGEQAIWLDSTPFAGDDMKR